MVVEGREGDDKMTEKACVLRPDLVEKGGESCRVLYFEAILGVKYRASFVVHLPIK